MNELNEVLKAVRNQQGLSQKDFAQRIGMKPAAYNMIESGKNQPSYALLNTIVSIFNLDANILFNKNEGVNIETNGLVLNTDSEADFLNRTHDLINRIDYLYQRLIDIRILLFQEFRIEGKLSTQSEVELLQTLTRPVISESDTGSGLNYPYENLDREGKTEYLRKLEACATLFTNTFFECFKQLYNGIRIPEYKKESNAFLKQREKVTDNWKYTHVFKITPKI